MNDTQLIIIVLGVVGVIGLAVLAYFGKKTAEIAGLVTPMFDLLIDRADTVLAGYGPELQPLHEIFDAAEAAIDEPTDIVAKIIANPQLLAALKTAIEAGQNLTDGKAESANLIETVK